MLPIGTHNQRRTRKSSNLTRTDEFTVYVQKYLTLKFLFFSGLKTRVSSGDSFLVYSWQGFTYCLLLRFDILKRTLVFLRKGISCPLSVFSSPEPKAHG